jgi:hypothetical protein
MEDDIIYHHKAEMVDKAMGEAVPPAARERREERIQEKAAAAVGHGGPCPPATAAPAWLSYAG